ncbi:MAG: stage 0 sporulation protein [Defluviitaleaceae bacterium]|nr:stage 0 sporulation protein [Defluviitaleaceae bacterium]
MSRYVGVRFKKAGKISIFSYSDLKLKRGESVITENINGLKYGKVEIENPETDLDFSEICENKIIRIATENDKIQNLKNKKKEEQAYFIFLDKIKYHKLDIKLIEVEITFDNSKITFYFKSENRIDFRELVKELAAIFKIRIELRQVGFRDETKFINSIGMCGRSLCCSTFLDNFRPVSIKMAKEQGLLLNPSRISGICGRLMCCLKYEEKTYEDLSKILPKKGDVVNTPDGIGIVSSLNLLQGIVNVRIRRKDDTLCRQYYDSSEIFVIKKTKI